MLTISIHIFKVQHEADIEVSTSSQLSLTLTHLCLTAACHS